MQGFLDDVLTSTERDYLERARGFGREVLAGKADAMEAGESVVPMMRKAVEYDLLRLETPTSHGGLGHRYLVKLAVLEALSHVDMAFAFAMTNTQNVAPRLLASGQEEHVEAIIRGEIFAASALSEPGAGSDFAGIRTRATKTDGGWLLNGEKAGSPMRRLPTSSSPMRRQTRKRAGAALAVSSSMRGPPASRERRLTTSLAERQLARAASSSTIISSPMPM